ncbi:MAG: SpoVR family protein [Gemmataceae bacterium]|nr:SpoVR family protein [Gemmataceae bacterium]
MGIPYDTRLPPDLRALKEEIEGHARAYGLDFYETIFEVIDAEDLNEIAAYGGFPTRYPHWSFGMSYEELKKGYDYGLSKIYEMVINNDPCYAYLMRCNHTVDQKLVMAHVYGHCLAPETLIETADGVKPIIDVRAGDQVLTHTGAYRPVRLCARRPFKGEIYRVTIAGAAEKVRITGEHPVYLLRERTPPQRSTRPFSRWVPTWELAGKMRVGDHVVLSRTPALVGAVDSVPDYLDVAYGVSIDEARYPRVVSVETEDYDGPVYNFSVEKDESYTLAAGMVVHNCDFFKNNAYFAHTSRKMMDEMANHGVRVRRYAEKYGEDEVETFVDKCMSIDDLIDIHSTAIKRRDEVSRYDFKEQEEEELKLTRFKSKDYMDGYINPAAALKKEEEERRKLKEQTAKNFPERPEKDVLLFLIENAPLKGWQRDVLSIVRDEAYYFAPQGQTKVLNEGWASFWHSTIMTERALEAWECIDYADHHSGTMATSRGRVNPYKLGIELLRDIEHRWNTGKFGKEYDDCDNLDDRRNWNRKLNLGRQKIFEVRRVHNDITFIDTFLTPEFCVQHKMFSFNYNDQSGQYIIESREFEKIKKRLLFSLTNFGKPWIYVVDGNYRNRGELLLRHEHNGIDLRLDRAADTLANVQFLWGRPVHLQTIVDEKPSLMSYDGSEHSLKTVGDADDPRKHPPGKTR